MDPVINAPALLATIRGMYPEIGRNRLSLAVEEDPGRKVWAVRVAKGEHSLTTYLEPSDVASCLSGTECIHLANQLGQFIRNYCSDAKDCAV